jgi:hypothetical protein
LTAGVEAGAGAAGADAGAGLDAAEGADAAESARLGDDAGSGADADDAGIARAGATCLTVAPFAGASAPPQADNISTAHTMNAHATDTVTVSVQIKFFSSRGIASLDAPRRTAMLQCFMSFTPFVVRCYDDMKDTNTVS